MRVVFDTNVLLVALPSHSPFHALYQAVVAGRLTLFVTTETLAEYEEQISRRLGIARPDAQLRELLNLPSVQELTSTAPKSAARSPRRRLRFQGCLLHQILP